MGQKMDKLAEYIKKQLGITFEIEENHIWFRNHLATWTISEIERLDGKTSYIVNMKPINHKKYVSYGKICANRKELLHNLAIDDLIKQTNTKRRRRTKCITGNMKN